MQPYQEATEEVRRQSEAPSKFIKKAASTGLAITGGTALALKGGSVIASRILSLLDKRVPRELAIKGLERINPTLGKFIKTSVNQGRDVEDVMDFISEKANQPSKQQKNIIEQESQELHQFILDQIRNGRNPIEAAAIAQNDKRFSSAIKKLMKTHKTPWSSIIESIFGSGEQALPQQSGNSGQLQQPQQSNPQAKDQLLQAMQNLSQQLRS